MSVVLQNLWAADSAVTTRASIPAAALTVGASIVAFILSYTEHVRSIQPSFILDVYLFFTIIFDIVRVRTLWLMGYNHNIAIAYTGYLAVKVVCLLLESVEKKGFLKHEYKEYPPEALTSIFNRSTFWWLNRLFRMGFGRLLFMDDLFQLDKHLKSEHLEKLLDEAWSKGMELTKHGLKLD